MVVCELEMAEEDTSGLLEEDDETWALEETSPLDGLPVEGEEVGWLLGNTLEAGSSLEDWLSLAGLPLHAEIIRPHDNKAIKNNLEIFIKIPLYLFAN